MPLPTPLAAGFVVLGLLMAGLFMWASWAAPLREAAATRRRWGLRALAVAAVYLGVSAALAFAGVLGRLDTRPPPVVVMLIALAGGVAVLAFSRFGDRLLAWPLEVLVGFQAFRVLVELLLTGAYHAGSVPIEVTLEGLNFDIVTGVLAVVLGVWLWRGAVPRTVVLTWNVLGLVLLAVVVGLSSASAFGAIETAPRMALPITWPGVWLPAWLVQLALFGHLLVFRALRRDRPAPM